MTDAVDRQVELTLPMVEHIELAVIKTAADLARTLGMGSVEIDEISHAIIEACINAREHACCADERIYLRFLGGSPKTAERSSRSGSGTVALASTLRK